MRALHCAVAVFVTAIALWPSPASAVTVEQIVALSKAGVSEAVILALIDRDRTVLTIEPDQLVALKRDGLTDSVLTAMLKSGRDDADDAARAVSAANASSVLASLDSAPSFVVVGHGPERPNTVHTEDFYLGLRDGVRIPPAIATGPLYPFSYRSGYRRSFADRAFQLPPPAYGKGKGGDRALCVAQVNTPSGRGPSYVTECPPVMQKALRSK